MSQAELLKLVIETLNRLGIDAMLVGSLASSFYGEARTTHDIDLVIDPPGDLIDQLVASFPAPRYYLSPQALREGRMANLIDTESGDQVDLWILGSDPEARAEKLKRQIALQSEAGREGLRVWQRTLSELPPARRDHEGV